jgi:hypothetical protein
MAPGSRFGQQQRKRFLHVFLYEKSSQENHCARKVKIYIKAFFCSAESNFIKVMASWATIRKTIFTKFILCKKKKKKE